MQRREFIRICAAAAAASGAPGALAEDARPHLYPRARLVSADGSPLRSRAVPAHRNFVFNYPYASTPCFLLNLGRPAKPSRLATADRHGYEWRGGVGADRSIVAYSAICAHQMAYPTKEISFISYRTEKSARNRLGNVIHCCAEHSQYDPADGARVLAGPAPQPLAAILLEHDPGTDELAAVGTLGGEMFSQFFAKYAFRLEMESGAGARREAGGTCVVQPLENYCKQQVKC